MNRKCTYIFIVPILIVCVIGFYFKKELLKSYDKYAYGTYKDPKKALSEVSASLEMISKYINTGASKVIYLSEIDKGVSKLGYLNEVENTTLIIFKKY